MRPNVKACLICAGLFAAALSLIPADAEARVVLRSRGPSHHLAPAHQEFVIEGGLAEPAGDQKDGFFTTDNGFDAATGFQLGLRYRYYLGGSLAIAPAFHYTRLGEANGITDTTDGLAGYSLLTSQLRYGLDLQAFLGEPGMRMRPYVTGGVSLINNRYRDELEGSGVFETSVNSPALSAGFGIKFENLELAAEYTFNRFSTPNLNPEYGDLDYNWDIFVVRVGLALGR